MERDEPIVDAALGDPPAEHTPAITPVRMLAVIIQGRRLIVGAALLGFVAAAVFSLTREKTWTSSASFFPKSTAASGGLQGLATELGLGGDVVESPEFYADLLRSRAILVPTIDARYSAVIDGERRQGDLRVMFGIKGKDRLLTEELTMDALRKSLSANIKRNTGVITMSVTTPSAELSHQIGTKLIALVNSFNEGTRRSQARAERQFMELRRAGAQKELRAAEDALQEFLVRNRQFETSADLNFRYERLRREVMTRQDVFLSVAQAFERARIEEVRNTPVITVIDSPGIPANRNPRGTVTRSIIGFLVGGGLALLFLLMRELFMRTRHQDPAAYESLGRARSDAAREVRAILVRMRPARR